MRLSAILWTNGCALSTKVALDTNLCIKDKFLVRFYLIKYDFCICYKILFLLFQRDKHLSWSQVNATTGKRFFRLGTVHLGSLPILTMDLAYKVKK